MITMVHSWKTRRKAGPIDISHKKVEVLFGNKAQNYKKLYLEHLKQRLTAEYLQKHGASKAALDRATKLKWQSKQMLADMQTTLVGEKAAVFKPVKVTPDFRTKSRVVQKRVVWFSRNTLNQIHAEAEKEFTELVKPKLERDLGEMKFPETLRNAKNRLRKWEASK
jgi:hypothetical protein